MEGKQFLRKQDFCLCLYRNIKPDFLRRVWVINNLHHYAVIMVCSFMGLRETEIPCGNGASAAINWDKAWPLRGDRSLVA